MPSDRWFFHREQTIFFASGCVFAYFLAWPGRGDPVTWNGCSVTAMVTYLSVLALSFLLHANLKPQFPLRQFMLISLTFPGLMRLIYSGRR